MKSSYSNLLAQFKKKFSTESSVSTQKNISYHRDWTIVLLVSAVVILMAIGYGLNLFLVVAQSSAVEAPAVEVAEAIMVDRDELATIINELQTQAEYHAQLLEELPAVPTRAEEGVPSEAGPDASEESEELISDTEPAEPPVVYQGE